MTSPKNGPWGPLGRALRASVARCVRFCFLSLMASAMCHRCGRVRAAQRMHIRTTICIDTRTARAARARGPAQMHTTPRAWPRGLKYIFIIYVYTYTLCGFIKLMLKSRLLFSE